MPTMPNFTWCINPNSLFFFTSLWCFSCVGRIRTYDLLGMSQTSWPTAPPRTTRILWFRFRTKNKPKVYGLVFNMGMWIARCVWLGLFGLGQNNQHEFFLMLKGCVLTCCQCWRGFPHEPTRTPHEFQKRWNACVYEGFSAFHTNTRGLSKIKEQRIIKKKK